MRNLQMLGPQKKKSCREPYHRNLHKQGPHTEGIYKQATGTQGIYAMRAQTYEKYTATRPKRRKTLRDPGPQ